MQQLFHIHLKNYFFIHSFLFFLLPFLFTVVILRVIYIWFIGRCTLGLLNLTAVLASAVLGSLWYVGVVPGWCSKSHACKAASLLLSPISRFHQFLITRTGGEERYGNLFGYINDFHLVGEKKLIDH